MLDDLQKQLTSLQKQIDNLVKPEIPAVAVWTDWTPTLTQSGTVTATVTFARYKLSDANEVKLEVRLAVTGTGTGANAITISNLPYQIRNSSNSAKGTARITDTGTATYAAIVTALSATQIQFTEANTGQAVGVNPNFALANTDVISFECTYERG